MVKRHQLRIFYLGGQQEPGLEVGEGPLLAPAREPVGEHLAQPQLLGRQVLIREFMSEWKHQALMIRVDRYRPIDRQTNARTHQEGEEHGHG